MSSSSSAATGPKAAIGWWPGARGRLHYEPEKNQLRVNMSYVSTYGDSNSLSGTAQDPSYPMPLPEGFLGADYASRPTDLSWPELMVRRTTIGDDVRQAEELARIRRRPIPQSVGVRDQEWNDSWKNLVAVRVREKNLLDVEIHLRPSLALGCLIFALVGGPVGIWFSRADYLSSFVSCFLPTVIVYYPLLLSGLNLAKEGRVPASLGLWAANIVVGVGALILYQRVVRRGNGVLDFRTLHRGPPAGAKLLHRPIVLIFDVADNLLQHVLQRDHAMNLALGIAHECHRLAQLIE